MRTTGAHFSQPVLANARVPRAFLFADRQLKVRPRGSDLLTHRKCAPPARNSARKCLETRAGRARFQQWKS